MPGLRENIRDKLSREPQIDKEFSSLIPPLTPEEFSGLEQSIIAEGCRDAIILWNNIIIDGHNRYKICTEHKIPFRTETKDFASREDVILWMFRNQLSRRNLNDFQRVEIVRKCENAVKAEAAKRQEATRFGSGGYKLTTNVEKSRDTLGTMAKVSGSTYEHATAIIDQAPEAVTNAVRRNELSINAGYEVTRMSPQEQAEIAELIERGEKPSQAVSAVKKRIAAKNDKARRNLTVRLSAEEYKQVKALAHAQKTDMDSMILELVREALCAHSESL